MMGDLFVNVFFGFLNVFFGMGIVVLVMTLPFMIYMLIIIIKSTK